MTLEMASDACGLRHRVHACCTQQSLSASNTNLCDGLWRFWMKARESLTQHPGIWLEWLTVATICSNWITCISAKNRTEHILNVNQRCHPRRDDQYYQSAYLTILPSIKQTIQNLAILTLDNETILLSVKQSLQQGYHQTVYPAVLSVNEIKTFINPNIPSVNS